ncbi:MAG: hypothetical protein EZS28_028717 [Streblomastix strix]|uniref:Uncharacterized protein n=1 Tax=Streblomastix strix TaxID=222440 RepID=A0A5J4UYK9_9EUKA|nr:MAG: hypothetical protein EZS28_028717 [Streblomastix strix]
MDKFMAIFRFIAMAVGPIIATLGVLAIINVLSSPVSTFLIGIYVFIFGVMIVLGEMKSEKLLKFMPQLLTRRYRAIFIIFGMIMFERDIDYNIAGIPNNIITISWL